MRACLRLEALPATASGELSVAVASGRGRKLYHPLLKRPDGRPVLRVYDQAGSPTVNLTL